MKGIRIDVSLLRSTVEKVLENSLPDQDQMAVVFDIGGSFFVPLTVPPTFCPIWSDLMISIHDGGYYRISTSYGTYFLQREHL